jgi:hypothetical protein
VRRAIFLEAARGGPGLLDKFGFGKNVLAVTARVWGALRPG